MERMTFDQWRRGVRPKIDSSRNLHKHLPNLSFFIMLASLTGVAGHMSQANYAAGNTFQDALARHRTAHGQPAVALDLGAVRSVGYVADREDSGDDHLRARVKKLGFSSVDITTVLRLVEAAICDPLRASPATSQVIIGLAETSAAPSAYAATRRDRRFGTLQLASPRGRGSAVAASASNTNSTAALVRVLSSACTTMAEAAALLVDAVAGKLADIFNIPVSEIDTGLPLSRYGVDSLVAVELRNWLSGVFKAKVSVFEILQSASLMEFGALVAGKSDFMSSKGVTQEGGGNV